MRSFLLVGLRLRVPADAGGPPLRGPTKTHHVHGLISRKAWPLLYRRLDLNQRGLSTRPLLPLRTADQAGGLSGRGHDLLNQGCSTN